VAEGQADGQMDRLMIVIICILRCALKMFHKTGCTVGRLNIVVNSHTATNTA